MTTELEIIVEYQRRRIDDLQGERARLGEQLDRLGEQVDRLQGLLEREQVLRQQAQGQLDRLAERLTLPAPELDVVAVHRRVRAEIEREIKPVLLAVVQALERSRTGLRPKGPRKRVRSRVPWGPRAQ